MTIAYCLFRDRLERVRVLASLQYKIVEGTLLLAVTVSLDDGRRACLFYRIICVILSNTSAINSILVELGDTQFCKRCGRSDTLAACVLQQQYIY